MNNFLNEIKVRFKIVNNFLNEIKVRLRKIIPE